MKQQRYKSSPANAPGNVNRRRSEALQRLERQLVSGVKNDANGVPVALNETDIKRISREVMVLRNRVTSDDVAYSKRTKKESYGRRKYSSKTKS